MALDFKSLNEFLKPKILELLTEWMPGGRLVGHEYQCGNKMGGLGDSLRYNVDKLTGSDFATGETYGDILDVHCKLNNLPVMDAAKQLAERYGYLEPEPQSPFEHYRHGYPSHVWIYNDAFKVARYDTPSGKQFAMWTFVDGRWVPKAPDKPRPLYNVRDLAVRPNAPVLVVEGEKAAEAAKLIVGDEYTVTTWPNGAAAVHAADWGTLKGRRVVIWPDADEPGKKAAQQIADKLSEMCPEIKIINVDDHSNGWDAADSGFTWADFCAWATPRTRAYQAIVVAATPQAMAVAGVQVNVESENPVELTKSQYNLCFKLGLASAGKKPVQNMDNVCRVLERHEDYKKNIWYDEFHDKYFTILGGTTREWTDDDTLFMTRYLQQSVGLVRISDDIVYKGIRLFARQDIRNEPRDWMGTLVWDNTPRIETFFIDCAGAPDTEYIRAVSRNFFISMTARVYRPGCKVDNMIIVEGPQGKLKSTLLSTIGNNWHCESTEQIHSKDFLQAMKGKLIIEFADLSNWPKDDMDILKKTITCRIDRYRPSYGRISQDFPRMSVFAGTTNSSIYLHDETGARRFWPIKTRDIDIPRVKSEREQLFAEAVHLFKANASWWEMPESTIAEQELRRQVDVWEDILSEKLKLSDEVLPLKLAEFLGIPTKDITKSQQMRIGRIMRKIGWEPKDVREEGRTLRKWFRGVNKLETPMVSTEW